MADAASTPRPVSAMTTHITHDGVEMVVTGTHGSLALRFHAGEPTISFPDWERLTHLEDMTKRFCALLKDHQYWAKRWTETES
jgi:hypothetical protein